MKITFDPNKSAINYRKHGIRFSDAESVLFDPLALTREDKDADGEQRFYQLVWMPQGNFLLSSSHTAEKKFV